MKKFHISFLLSISFLVTFSQTPDWVDFNKRQKVYPTDEYLVGYSQETGVKKDGLQVSYDYIEQLARGELIESVQVLVNSVSSSEMADYDGEFTDFFKNKTVSSSSANLVGLKTERYYDKKKKKTHLLVYIKRADIVDYYVSLINKGVSNIRQLVEQGNSSLEEKDYKKAFQSYYSSHVTFLAIDESQTYLLALGVNSSMRLRTEEVNELKTNVQTKLTQLNGNTNKTLDDISFFVAFALGKEQVDSDSVLVEQFGYQETTLPSKFSYRLQQNVIQDLGANSNYSIQKGEQHKPLFRVQGTYWEKGEMLLVKAELFDFNKKTALKSFRTSIAKEKLSSGMTFLSPDITNIRQIPFLQVTSLNEKMSGKVGFGLQSELKVKAKLKDENGILVPAYNLPIKFVDKEHNIIYGNSWTDKYGNAKFKVNRLKNGSRNQVIVAELDLDNYLSVDKDNKYLTKVLRNSAIPSSNFYITVKESLVYFKVNELNFGKVMGVPVVEPNLKKYLSDAGFKFTDEENKSDLIVTINSDTRKGGEASGVYFSYVDVNISIREKVSKKEVFKKSFNGYKGAGGTFEQAGSKSYNQAVKEICPEVHQLLTQ